MLSAHCLLPVLFRPMYVISFVFRLSLPLYQLKLFCQRPKSRHSVLDGFISYTVGDPDIARAGKGRPWDKKDPVLLDCFTEKLLILHRRLHKEIEGALRLNAGKSQRFEPLVDGFTVSVIIGYV